MKSKNIFISFLAFFWLGMPFNSQTVQADSGSSIPEGTTIIAEGDSITAGYHLGAGEDWPSILMTTPNFADKGTKYNFSVSSSEVNWLAGRYSNKIYPLRPQNGEKAILFVWAGTNDILVTDQSAADVYTELASYWQRAKDDGFEVWAFTIIERANFTPEERTQAQELNRLIREGTIWDRLVDIAPLFPDPSNSSLYLDGIHPTKLGSIKIAQFVNDLAGTSTSFTQTSAQTLSIKDLFATGGVGIGTIAPQEALDVMGNVVASGNIVASGNLMSAGLLVKNSANSSTARVVGDGQAAGVMIDRFIPNVNSGVLQLRKARGSLGAPGAVLKSDTLGGISFWGYQNGSFQLSSMITSKVDAAPAGAVVPSNLQFYTKNSAGSLIPALTLDKDGSVIMPAVYNSTVVSTTSNARDLQIDATGRLGYLASSARYKEDVVNLTGTDWLYDLRPVSFKYLTDQTGTNQVGLIAEEVEDVVKGIYPDLVSYSATDPEQVETVNYSKLIVPLLNEIQRLNKRVEALERSAQAN